MTQAASAYVAQLGAGILGVVFLLSSVPKARRPSVFISDVRAYGLLPTSAATAVAWTILTVELALAVALLAGFTLIGSLSVALALLTAFLIAVTTNLARGRVVPCGCFAARELISRGTAARLVLLLMLTIASLSLRIGAGDPPWRLDLTTAVVATAGLIVAAAASAPLVREVSHLLRVGAASTERVQN